ncbi:MAG: tetratricopeptide repeat protein, partial [Rhodomicrobiaceae bacterium]
MFQVRLRAMLAKAVIAVVAVAAVVTLPVHAQSQGDVGALNSQVEQLSNDGKYPQATPIAEQALALGERTLGPDHPETLRSVKNLGDLYQSQGRNDEAERLFKRALEARERVLGPDHLDTLVSVNDLAVLYQIEKRYAEA